MASRFARPSWRLALSIALVLSLAVGPLASAGASVPGEPSQAEHAPDRVLVGFKPGTPAKAVAAAHASLGAKAQANIPQIGVDVMRVPKGRTVESLIKAYLKNPNVEFAEPDYVVSALLTPDDPYYPDQWGMPVVNAPEAWDLTTGCDSVTVAVLDTGIDMTHPDLGGRVVGGYDFVNRDADASDDHGHGTLVAGIVGATGDNSIGVAGVNWTARLMSVKVLDETGRGYWSDIAEGITWAADHDVQVINMSFGGSTGSSAVADALDYAHGKGTMLVAGSGNDGTDTLSYPAAYEKVIAVGSLSDASTRSAFSNYGQGLSLMAPGQGIYTTQLGGGYLRPSGTSMSAPFVAGLAAMLSGIDPSLSPAQIRDIMQETAVDLGEPGYDIYYGNGCMNMADAVAAVSPADPAPQPEPDPTPEPKPEPAPEEPADVTPPTVRITSPWDGTVVSGNTWITAEASDDTGVALVEFFVDGVLAGTSSSEPYRTRWNSRKSSGEIVLVAVAWDAAGNSAASDPVTVTVDSGDRGKPPKKR